LEIVKSPAVAAGGLIFEIIIHASLLPTCSFQQLPGRTRSNIYARKTTTTTHRLREREE